jgi:hypothetical protein
MGMRWQWWWWQHGRHGVLRECGEHEGHRKCRGHRRHRKCRRHRERRRRCGGHERRKGMEGPGGVEAVVEKLEIAQAEAVMQENAVAKDIRKTSFLLNVLKV